MTAALTAYVLGEDILPAVHLDELDAAEDLVHEPHAPVRHGHALPAKVRRQTRCQHLLVGGRGEGVAAMGEWK